MNLRFCTAKALRRQEKVVFFASLRLRGIFIPIPRLQSQFHIQAVPAAAARSPGRSLNPLHIPAKKSTIFSLWLPVPASYCKSAPFPSSAGRDAGHCPGNASSFLSRRNDILPIHHRGSACKAARFPAIPL